MQDYYDRQTITDMQQELIESLNSRGVSDFHIALVLNTSEYQIKKLRRGI